MNSVFSFTCVQDLINQGRQKVLEATNALKALPRESYEDIVARAVSAADCRHTFELK